MKCFDFLDGGMIFTSSLIQLRLPNRNALEIQWEWLIKW